MLLSIVLSLVHGRQHSGRDNFVQDKLIPAQMQLNRHTLLKLQAH
uniref:Secreted protein n=1 Tax=Ascaris lumbricoides TaxID=6252 RepID=A0A0M3IKI1_ASCLU